MSRQLTLPERALFELLFATLREQQIPFVLLRNYESFPDQIGHDLDLFVPRRRAAGVAELFKQLLSKAGGEVIIVHERDYFIDIRFVLGRPAAEAIHLDLYHGSFTWHGLVYLEEDELLAAARHYGNLPIPRPAHEALNIFLASILWGGFFKARYQPQLAELLALPGEQAAFNECLNRAFGSTGLPPFDPASPALPGPELVQDYAKKLRSLFKRRQFASYPLRSAVRWLTYWLAELRCLARPQGLSLAVVGPEADLNAAVLESTCERIGELFGERHLRFRDEASSSCPPAPERGVAGLVREWFKSWRNWPRKLLKPKAQVHLTLLGRQPCNWSCQAERCGFGKLPRWLLATAAASAPRADFIFVLVTTGPGAKQTVTPTPDIEHARACYQRWAARGGLKYVLDSAKPLPELLNDVERIVVSHLKDRELRR